MKILIVKLSAFGDIIHALPALDDILEHPDVDEVHWLIDSRFAFVADIFPPQVKVHKVALKGDNRIRHAWQMIQMLRQQHFDIILDMQGLIKSGIMARASVVGKTKVYGFDKQQSPEWPNRLLVKSVPFHQQDTHVVQLYRRIATAINGDIPTAPKQPMPYQAPHISIDHKIQQAGEQWLQAQQVSPPFTVLHVGGSYSTKRLLDEQWRSLLQDLSAQSSVLILWGSKEEKQRAQFIAAKMPQTSVPEHVLSMPILAGIFSKASAYIGQDTGISHLAAACACPTVTLWGATSPVRMGAIGEHNRDITANVACTPCFSRRCDHFICMPSITTKQVMSTWQEVKR